MIFAKYTQQHSLPLNTGRRASRPVPMVVGCNSQFSGLDERKSTTPKPEERGLCVARGNSNYYYAPNGPFIKVRSE